MSWCIPKTLINAVYFYFLLILQHNDTENIGKATSCYKASTESNNDKSLVDDLIDSYVLLKSNKDVFKDKNKEKYMREKTFDETVKKIDTMAVNFLHNVVFRLQIADDSKFEPIIRAIRFDNNLSDKYIIKNAGNLQMFNIREQSIIFQDKNTKAVVLILIASPLFAKGAEIFNKAKKLFRDRGNLKA